MALEDSLGRVPGLAGYLGRQQFDREQSLGQLQQATAATTLAQSLKTQQEGAQIKEVLASSPDLQTAIPRLAALGPNGITVATHLAALEKARTEASMGADLQAHVRSGGGTITPAMYRSMGTRNLLSGNHAAAAPLFQEADRQDKLLQEQAALQGMKSTPAQSAIVPDVQETQQAADQGAVTPVPSAPVPASPGGVPEYLLKSPHVGESARALKARIDTGMIPNYATAEKQIENLGKSHDAMVQAKAMLGLRDQAGEALTPEGRLLAEELIRSGKPIPGGWSKNGISRGNSLLNSMAAHQEGGAGSGSVVGSIAQFAANQSTRRDFASGPTSRNITSLNQALAHIGTLDELFKAMENSDLPTVNRIVNVVKNETGRPDVNNASLATQAVGEELMRVFRQVNASEKEAAAFEQKLKVAGSPAQQRDALKTAATLLEGRLTALQDQWKRGTGEQKDFPIVGEKGQEVLRRIKPGATPTPQGTWKVTPIP
jgi:hypothetical protein